MAIPKDIEFGIIPRNEILKGSKLLYDAVASTFGPNGKNAIIDTFDGQPSITKDGVTVAKSISFSDKYKRIGASLIKDIATRVDTACGDGTTTSTIISYNLINAAAELVSKGFNPNDIRQALLDASKEAIQYIEKNSIKVKDSDDVYNIALSSSNGDEEIAKIVTEAFSSVGKDGAVFLSSTNLDKSFIEVSNGLTIQQGISSTDMVFDNTKKGSWVSEKPTKIVLLKDCPQKFEFISRIIKHAEIVSQNVLFIISYIDNQFLSECIMSIENGIMDNSFCIIKASGIPDKNLGYSKDTELLAALINSDIIYSADLQTIDFDSLATVDSVVSLNNSTTISLNEIDRNNEKYIKQYNILKNIIDSEGTDGGFSPDEIDLAKKRLAMLTGGVATIKIGYPTLTEREEKIDLYTDAINAVKTGFKKGISAGGGTLLLKASNSIKIPNNNSKKSPSYIEGIKAFKKVLRVPAMLLIGSVLDETDTEALLSKIAKSKTNLGFNARTGKIEKDLIKAGVIDASLIEILSLKYSVSTAGSFICSDCIITNEKDNLAINSNDYTIDNETFI